MAEDQRDQRLKKLGAIQDKGIEPYGRRYPKEHTIGECRALYEEKGDETPVRTAGRIVAQRDFGKAAFLNLKDRSGVLQAYIRQVEGLGRLIGLGVSAPHLPVRADLYHDEVIASRLAKDLEIGAGAVVDHIVSETQQDAATSA